VKALISLYRIREKRQFRELSIEVMKGTNFANDIDISPLAEQELHDSRVPLACCMMQRSIAIL
jgi:hypothetical protein